MHLTKLDVRTIRIEWSAPYGDYLTALAQLTPLPLHVYATGKFAGVYDPATGAYDAKLAKRLMADLSFNTKIPVDNGPFTVQDIVLNGPPVVFVGHTSQGGRVVLVKNPRFFSKFFHKPALDKVTIVSLWKDDKKHLDHTVLQEELIEAYRTGSMGGMTLALGLEPINLSHPGAIPKDEVVSSPYPGMLVMGFNQRGAAPNARANGGMSIFRDIKVRTAFMEAFDRCAAVQSVLGSHDCADPDLFTGELSVPPAPDHDSTVSLPAYNPANAAVLLDQAGYRVVGGLRRYKDGTTPLELTIPLSYHAFPYAGIAHRMQQDYQQHLKIVVKVVNAVNLFDSFDQGGLAQTGAFDVAVWGENFPLDPVGVLAAWGWDSASIPSAQNPNGYNWLGMIDPGVRAQDQLGSQEVDAGQRAEIYRNLARDVAQQVALEPLLIEADVALVQPTLCNFKKWPADGVNTWNMADWYLARGSTCP